MSRAVFRNDGTPPVFIRERYLQIRKTEGAADLKALAFFCLILYELNVTLSVINKKMQVFLPGLEGTKLWRKKRSSDELIFLRQI